MAVIDRKFIEGGLRHQISERQLVVFITLTENTHARDFVASGTALTKFIRDLGRSVTHDRNHGSLPWLAVGEIHREQTIHWHLLVAGLAYPWDRDATGLYAKRGSLTTGDLVTNLGCVGTVVSKDRTLKPLVAKHGFGSGFVGMRQVRTTADGMSGVGNYLSKYLAKGDAGSELPKGFQLVRSSRGRNAWWPGQTLVSVRAAHKVALAQRKSASRASVRAADAVGTLDDSGASSSLTLLPGGA